MMKRLTIILLTWLSALSISADNYTYLTFETTDGAKISVPAKSLTMTVTGATLKAGEHAFTLSNLSKMYFTTSDETTGMSEELRVKSEEFATAIYDLNGRKVSEKEVRNGVYVIRTKNGIFKIVVR